MSDENNNEGNEVKVNGKPQNMEISVEVSRSAELEEKQREIDDLRADLAVIAEKQLRTKVSEYGIDDNLSTEEQIEQVKEIELRNAHEADRSRSARALYGNMTVLTEQEKEDLKRFLPSVFKGVPTEQLQADNELDLVNELERRAKSGDAVASQYLGKIINDKKSWEFEYSTEDTKALYRRPHTPEERTEINAKRANWKKVK
jgi:hypothetical protein